MDYNALKDWATIVMGQSPKADDVNKEGEGLPLLNGPTEFGISHPSPVQYTTNYKKVAPKGSLLFCVRGSTTGRMNWADRDYAIGRGLAAIIPNNPIHKYFLRSVIETKINLILMSATGSTFPNVSSKQLAEISIPNLESVDQLASLLMYIDEKVTLNHNIIYSLEQISQTLFKHWFIDFEFLNEQDQPYKSSGGEMVESELGEIPKGWEVIKAKDLYDINIGKTPPRKEAYWFSTDSGTKWASISDLKSNDPYIMETKEYLVNEAISRHKVKIVPKDTVLLSFKLTIGRVAITHEEMATNEAIAHFNAVENVSPSFIYTYLYLKNFNYEKLGSTSSIATAVNSKIIKDMHLLTPSKSILNDFGKIVNHIFEQIKKLQEENKTLNTLRDTLLPKLLSGEIKIPDELEVK